jgi:dipeptidyl aminopeptidase/acylaminoacyl peptidase
MIADVSSTSAAGAARELVPGSIPATFPSSALVEPTSVTFRAADGRTGHGQLFVPPSGRGPFPALIFFHGGPIRQMLLGFHYMHYYSNAYAMNQYFANRGFVVLSVNYRGGIGYGLDYRESPGFGPGGASEYNDVLGAASYLRARADVDKSRIGLWGGSYGGYLTALGLARNSNLFAAGVDLHGVHDWNTYVRKGVDPMLGDATVQALLKQAYASSPVSAVKTWRSPVLIIQGDDDRNVPFHESVILVEMLRKQGVDVEQLVLPDEIHDFLLQSSQRAVYGSTAEYLIRKLRPGATAALR